MTEIIFENEYEGEDAADIFPFDCAKIAAEVADTLLREEKCPWDAEVNLTITGAETVHGVNMEMRGIDATTDVLSFPVFGYSAPGHFEEAESDPAGSFDPENGRLLLGDILINAERVRDQAAEYGHSTKREFAFLVTHSLLHLIGYDHMEKDEEEVMCAKQEQVLSECGITRD